MARVRQTKKKQQRKEEEEEEEDEVSESTKARKIETIVEPQTHDSAKERKKLAKRLRAIQDAYLSLSGFDYASIAAGGGGDGGDPVPGTRCWCPRCRYEMTAAQVERGFENSILDYRTACPECQFRFETSFAFADSARFVWLCPDQTRDQYALWFSSRFVPGEPGTNTSISVFDNDEESSEDIADVLLRDRPEIFFNAYRYSDRSNAGVKARVCQFLEI
jgi:hypothetical protein